MWLGRLPKGTHYQNWYRVLPFGARLWLFATWSIQNTNAAQYAAAAAHLNQTAPDSRIADTDSQEPAPSQTGVKPTEAADQTDKDKSKDEKHHDGAIVVAPVPIDVPVGVERPELVAVFLQENISSNSKPSAAVVGDQPGNPDYRGRRVLSFSSNGKM